MLIKKDPTISIRKHANELKVNEKTVTENEWNKMSEEFILKASKLFRRGVHTIIEKKKMAARLSKFTVFVHILILLYTFTLKLNLIYNRLVYYYTRIFDILLRHPIYYIYCYGCIAYPLVKSKIFLIWSYDKVSMNIFISSKEYASQLEPFSRLFLVVFQLI